MIFWISYLPQMGMTMMKLAEKRDHVSNYTERDLLLFLLTVVSSFKQSDLEELRVGVGKMFYQLRAVLLGVVEYAAEKAR